MNNFRLCFFLTAALLAVVAGPVVAAAAEPKPVEPPKEAEAAKVDAAKVEVEKPADPPGPSFRAAVRAMVEQEARKTGLPADIADAVVHIESNYDPSVIGGVGEIGLMQIRPGTAAMLGFRGTAAELAKPEVNIHYGVAYLSKAWRLANGDLCRTLMKYRAGHGEEVMTATLCELLQSGAKPSRRSGLTPGGGRTDAARYHPKIRACEQPAAVAADFTEGRLRAVSAGDARGEPGLLGRS